MRRQTLTWRLFVTGVVAWLSTASTSARGDGTTETGSVQLAGTRRLEWPEEDLSERLMDGAHRFVERMIDASVEKRGRFWRRDLPSTTPDGRGSPV